MTGVRGDFSGIGMTSERTRARMVDRLRKQGIADEQVLAAMAAVPRHLFVDDAIAHRAYEDTSLPINFGQTISQPYVVAKMIEALMRGKPLGRVLEIGTGCGYQAAVLAQIAQEVFSVERIRELHERARVNLRPLRLRNLRLVHGDGYLGLEQAAPYDSIVVAAAATQTPPALLQQLAPGGRMILPLRDGAGSAGATQRLVLIERGAHEYRETPLDAVRFVPLQIGKV